ncbi:MAG: RNA 2',3'-cyclic phosphodiesterase [Candidatus Omnitrophota bacterium]
MSTKENMGTVRAFIAIEINQQTKQKITRLISSLKESDADVRWVTEDQMHFTLKFLGDIPEDKTLEISDALKPAAENFNAFEISLAGLDAFPSLDKPRVVWIGAEKGAEELKALNVHVENSLEKIGFAKEPRGFKAHLTLGRVKSFKNTQRLARKIKNTEFNLKDAFRADEITLFQSTLTPKGAIYAPLAKFSMAQ